MSQDYVEIVVPDPNNAQWGWGWSCAPTGNNAYEVDTPSHPEVEGTIKEIAQYITDNPIYQSISTSGAFYKTAWFYKGHHIAQVWQYGLLSYADDLPLPELIDNPTTDHESEMMKYDQLNEAHHQANDKYGYGWFVGFHFPYSHRSIDEISIQAVENGKRFTTPCEVCNAPSITFVGTSDFATYDVEADRIAWLPYAEIPITCPDADTEEHQENAGTFTISRTEFDAAISEEEQ